MDAGLGPTAMRIMLLTLSPVPSRRAPGIQVANMAQAFVDAGHHVEVVAPTSDPTLRDVDATALLGFRPGFVVTALARRVHRGQSYLNALRIARIARRTRPDLVLARDLRGCLLPALRGIPTVYEVHSLSTLDSVQDRWALGRLRRSSGYRGIVAISQALADDLVARLGLDRSEVLVAHDGARPLDDPTVPPPAVAGQHDELHVAYTGSLYAGKGADLLLPLAERCPWAIFTIAGGPGTRADELRATVAARGLANVRLVGPVDPAEARTIQLASDMLIAPFSARVESDSGVDISRWTSPLKVFEYMATGRPMIVGDLPVLHEVLRPGVDALFAPLDDVDAFAAALGRLRDDATLRQRLGRSAQQRVLAAFTWGLRAAAILEWAGTTRRTATIVLASYGSGGAERVALNLAGGLARAAWTVRLVVADGRGPLRSDVPEGVRTVDLGARRLRAALPALLRELRRHPPELIVSTQTHVSLALLAALRFGRRRRSGERPRIVVRAPQLRPSGGPRTREDRWERRLLPLADLVIASSSSMARMLADVVGPGGPPVVELPNPVAIDELRAAAARGLPASSLPRQERTDIAPLDRVELVVVGRLVPEKAHDDLLRAIADAGRSDLKVTMIGDGPLRADLLAQSGALGLGDRVRWLGRVDDREVLLAEVARADLLVLPSRTEGMPNAVLEALAVGTPVLATTDLPMLAELADEVGPEGLRLVPRETLGDVLAAVGPTEGASPRPSLLPERFTVEAVTRVLLDAVTRAATDTR